MQRQQHDLIQGSPEWHQFRLEHHGASEAAAMLGLSRRTKRNELLRAKHTGVAKEFSDFVQTILENGHAVEALARPIVENMFDIELFPVTYSYGKLSASCDGLTMDGRIAFEHKQWNEELAAAIRDDELPEEYEPQAQQILHVTGAEELIFVCSDGTSDRLVWMRVDPDPTWVRRIEAGWRQFDADLANYQHVEVLPPVTGAPVRQLPALSVQIEGSITLRDNLSIFGSRLTEFVEGLNRKPETDQDFADAEVAVKTLEKAQEALETAEASALAQVSSVDEMRRTVAHYVEIARTARLALSKVVASRKEAIRVEVVQSGKDRLAAHVEGLNKRLGKPYMPKVDADFAGAIKGKRTIASLHDAVDTLLAAKKIETNEIADRIQVNLNTLRELASDHAFLFADTAQIVLKACDDLKALVENRIATHKAEEERKLAAERERIRQEEVTRLEAEAKARSEAEAKAKAEEEARARAEAEARVKAEATAAAPQPAPDLAQAPQPAPAPQPAGMAIAQAAAPSRADAIDAISPTKAAIVTVLAQHYRVPESVVDGWLKQLFMRAAA